MLRCCGRHNGKEGKLEIEQGGGNDSGNEVVCEIPCKLLETHINIKPSGQILDVSVPSKKVGRT
jgi:hypothetical protein